MNKTAKILLLGFLVGGLSLSLPASAQTSYEGGLRLEVANQNVRAYWTNAAYYFLLQSTTNLASSNSWVNESSAALPVVSNTFPSPSASGYPVLTSSYTNSEIFFSASAGEARKFYRLKSPQYVPLSSFAVFYNGLLEFSTAPTMVFNGLVHANGPIYLGSGSPVIFNQPVTTTATISSPQANGNGPWTTANWNVVLYGSPPFITNCPSLSLNISTNNPHTLIEIPPSNENPTSTIGSQRLYNEAQMVLIVTNSAYANPTVQLTIQKSVNGAVPGADPSPSVLYYANALPSLLQTNLPFLSLNNIFYDQREMKTNLVTQIDISLFASWILTNSVVQGKLPSGSGLFPTILYVADERVFSATQNSVVRLINGAQLPSNNGLGFSVATPNPLYVWGNYNVQTATSAAGASAATTNTTYTVPSALFSDALTILSANWNDANANLSYSTRTPVTTTVNAAIVTGTVPSTGTDYYTFSGGVHNLPRLLENWSASQKLYLNTSILRLWDSTMATNQFRDPAGFSLANNPYYNPPSRQFSFDPNFLNPNRIPPGMPLLSSY